MTDSFTFSEDFTNVNNHVRSNWEMGRHAAKNVEKRLNELVALVHKEEPEWSINKIAQQIWVANEDLEGFTTKTIYNNLDESNRMLLDHSKQNRNRNKFPEESVVTLQHKVIEDSSSPTTTRTLPTAYQIKDADSQEFEKDLPEPQQEIEDLLEQEEPVTFDKDFVNRLVEENAVLREPYETEYDFELPNGEIFPFIIRSYPDLDKRTAKLSPNKAKK